MPVNRIENSVCIITAHTAYEHLGYPLPSNGSPCTKTIHNLPRAVNGDITGNTTRLGFHNAIEIGNARDRINSTCGAVVSKIIGNHFAHGLNTRPGGRRIVVNRDEHLEMRGLGLEIHIVCRELFLVLFYEHKFHLLLEIIAECRNRIALSIGVHHRRATGLVIGPRAVFDLPIAKGNILALNRFDFHLKKRYWIWKSFPMCKTRHAIGFEFATRHSINHRSIYGIERISINLTVVTAIRGCRPQNIGFVHIAPVRAPTRKAQTQVLNGAKPL